MPTMDREDKAMIIDSLKYNGLCACGREHKMETEFCVVESGCLKNIKEYLNKYNLKGYTVAVYDENTYKATEDRRPDFDYEIILSPDNLHANEHGVDLLFKKMPKQTELLIAIGSGTVHDIVRYCAYKNKIDFVSCPTAASVDGFCSSVAAMTWHGCKKTLTAVAPRIVIADIDIIKKAPVRLAKSGFGDMVGKYIALTDWKIGNILCNEFYCDRIAEMTLKATKAVLESADGIVSGSVSAFENLMYGLLLSGLAMQMMGNSRPASGAEHHISHLIEMNPAGLDIYSDALHGEKVGVGTLIALEEYQKLSQIDNIEFKSYSTFTAEDILKIFGNDKLDELLQENKNDAAALVTSKMLKNNWKAICREISKLPDAKALKKLYKDLDIKSSLNDIEVSDDMREALLEFSPMVRNRLTLMRLRKCLSI